MRNLFTIFAFYVLFFFTPTLRATPSENWTPSSAKVGEEVSFTLEYTETEVFRLNLPEVGFLSKEGNPLPYLDVVSVSDTPGKLVIRFQFLKPGKYTAPISWIEKEGDVPFVPTLEINIESNLTESESEPFDITGPMEFNGPFLKRLILVVLIFGAVFVLLAYILLRVTKRKLPARDAEISYPFTGEGLEPADKKLKELLRQKEIPHKEYAYALSDYLKYVIGNKLGTDMMHMTVEEMSELMINQYNIDKLTVLRLIDYMNSIKYMPNDESIDFQKAVDIKMHWERQFRI